QAVVSARKLLAEEIPVAADERWMSNLLKQRQDFVVLHSFTADIAADLTEVNSPGTQPRSLTLEDVLIQHDQAETGLARYSSACWTIARPARRMASAIAGREMLPWHSAMISSQAIPAATNSRTSPTRIRVPRNVSLPWQTLGSAVMNRPGCF